MQFPQDILQRTPCLFIIVCHLGFDSRQLDLLVDPLSPSSKVGLEIEGRPKRKRKERQKEEKALEADVIEKEDDTQKDEAKSETRSQNLCVEDGQQLKVVNHR